MAPASLLIEIGCEEIPARWLAGLANGWAQAVARELQAAALIAGDAEPRVFYTPRRLALRLAAVQARQPDREEEVLGPPARLAFGADGRPTPQAAGFAAKQGAAPEALYRAATPKGEYAALKRRAAGRELADLLAEILRRVLAAADLPKTMRWDGDGLAFVRPIRWLLALHGETPLALALGGIAAGRASRGHRTLGAGAVEIAAADAYEAALERAGVLAAPAARRQRIEAGLAAAAAGGVSAIPDAALLETLVNLCEFPTVLRGGFDAAFLELPAEVLTTVMRDHQKYFAVRAGGGALAPGFLAVMDLDADRDGLIRHGHERVLRARFNDARFFWRTDRKRPLASRRDDLKHVTFQAKLGTYFEKSERIARLAAFLAPYVGAGADAAAEAARLAKCDLTTELVKEFTELQGVMGGLYLRAEGVQEEVWQAVYDHYLPLAADGEVPRGAAGAAVALADKLDTLAGMFLIGEAPTGSRDPFALRRAANGVIRILRRRACRLSLAMAVGEALVAFDSGLGDMAAAQPALLEFFRERQEFYLREVEARAADEAAAVLAAGADDPVDAGARAEALAAARRQQPELFARVAGALKRIRNIVRKEGGAEQWRARTVRDDRLLAPAEQALANAVRDLVAARPAAAGAAAYRQELAAIAALGPLLEEFFNAVRVNDPDPDLRANRLALLAWAGDELSRLADFALIVIPGA
ncbi:MAG TPA: glycine--tRNA ligase subunit beta [Terriglobales bacterium]|nr:glycine--tRNA ligase subunit beta [Terriglobales bacterium]